jgi:hypothetical protein
VLASQLPGTQGSLGLVNMREQSSKSWFARQGAAASLAPRQIGGAAAGTHAQQAERWVEGGLTERKLAAEQVGVPQRVRQRGLAKAEPACKARALLRPAPDLVPAASHRLHSGGQRTVPAALSMLLLLLLLSLPWPQVCSVRECAIFGGQVLMGGAV